MNLIFKQLFLILENVRTLIYSYQPAGHMCSCYWRFEKKLFQNLIYYTAKDLKTGFHRRYSSQKWHEGIVGALKEFVIAVASESMLDIMLCILGKLIVFILLIEEFHFIATILIFSLKLNFTFRHIKDKCAVISR